MVFFKIRSPRVSVEIPITIFLKDRDSGVLSKESLSGVLVQFSPRGARVVVPKVMLGGDHIFFSSQEQERFYLCISDFTIENQETYEINSVSIWMDGFVFDGNPAFKIGVKFLDNQKKIFDLLKNMKCS